MDESNHRFELRETKPRASLRNVRADRKRFSFDHEVDRPIDRAFAVSSAGKVLIRPLQVVRSVSALDRTHDVEGALVPTYEQIVCLCKFGPLLSRLFERDPLLQVISRESRRAKSAVVRECGGTDIEPKC